MLDESGVPTGQVKRRGDVHRDGDWHAALHLWIGGMNDDGSLFVLFQRRSLTKDTWPGALDVAVGGHVGSGESLADSLREAEEEIGLRVSVASLVRLGRRLARAASVPDNEVQEVYALRSDLPLESYRLHEQEVDALVRMPLDAALALFAGHVREAAGVELCRDARAQRELMVGVHEFAGGSRDGYPLHALHGLHEVLAGRSPEPFELR